MLRSADRHYRESALLAGRAAAQSRTTAPDLLARLLSTYQLAQARLSETAVGAMLLEQGIEAPAEGRIVASAFTTAPTMFRSMLDTTTDPARLVASLVQTSGRAVESAAITARPKVAGHVRYLSPPSCSRCAVLAGRIYRYSTGFQRHPGCDCVMVPTTEQSASGLVSDPTDLVAQGKVTGLSKDDLRAIRDGADLGNVVNVRRSAAGLTESGRVLVRAGKPTPAGIYRISSNRTEAIGLLKRYGYLR